MYVRSTSTSKELMMDGEFYNETDLLRLCENDDAKCKLASHLAWCVECFLMRVNVYGPPQKLSLR